MTARTAYCAALLGAALTGNRAGGQSPVRIEPRGPSTLLTNDLPVETAVLYRINTDSVTWRLAFHRLPARSRVDLPEVSTQIVLERVEPLLATVGLRTKMQPVCAGAAQANLDAAIRNLEDQARATPLEGSKEADEAIAAAAQLAQLRLERTRDSLDVRRNSMVDFTARLRATPSMSLSQLAKQADADRTESRNQTIEDIGYAAFAYAEAASAKYEVLSRDADRYGALLENSKAALSTVHRQLQLISQEVDAKSTFQDAVAAALLAARPLEESALVVNAGASVRRACASAAGVDDQILVSGISAGKTAAIRGEVAFNSGERHTVVLRRISGTQEWVGTLSWPVTAAYGALRVQAPGANRWISLSGRLDAGRPSLRDTEAKLARNVAEARKRFKEAQFRAQGADHIKSIIVP